MVLMSTDQVAAQIAGCRSTVSICLNQVFSSDGAYEHLLRLQHVLLAIHLHDKQAPITMLLANTGQTTRPYTRTRMPPALFAEKGNGEKRLVDRGLATATVPSSRAASQHVERLRKMAQLTKRGLRQHRCTPPTMPRPQHAHHRTRNSAGSGGSAPTPVAATG